MHTLRIIRCSVAALLVLVACSDGRPADEASPGDPDANRVTTEQLAWQRVQAGALLLDVRTPAEFADGHLEGAVNIPYDQIAVRAAELGADRKRGIVLYCRSGRRSSIAEKTLNELGYTRVLNAGGYQALRQARPAE